MNDRTASRLTAVHPVSTTEQVAGILRTAILRGQLRQGEHLSEAVLAARLRVSKGSVREALHLLAGDRLAEHRPRQGFFVAELAAGDVRELYEARYAIENAAGRLMIRRQDLSVAGKLREQLEILRAAVADGDWPAIGDADLEFHRIFVAGAGNSRLDRVMSLLLFETRVCLAGLEGTYDQPADLVTEHAELIRALELGDAALLTRLQEQHMADAVRRLS